MTTRRTRGADRTASIVLGLALVAVALLAWDWRLGLTGWTAGAIDLGGADSALDASWWPWVAAVVGVLLGLAGLAWLLSHLPRITSPHARLAASDATGRLEADLGPLAKTLAERWESLAPVSGARGRTTPDAPGVVLLTAHVDLEADVETLAEAAGRIEREVAGAFPDGDVRVRFLLDGPSRQPRTRRSTEITVEEPAPVSR